MEYMGWKYNLYYDRSRMDELKAADGIINNILTNPYWQNPYVGMRWDGYPIEYDFYFTLECIKVNMEAKIADVIVQVHGKEGD